MKNLYLVFAVLFASPAVAEDYWFCIANSATSDICSEVEIAPNDEGDACRDFALEHDASRWTWWTSESRALLIEKQDQVCDEIASDRAQFSCHVEEFCHSTSSISPLDHQVFAEDEQSAMSRCVEKNKNQIMALLESSSNAGCYLKISVDSI